MSKTSKKGMTGTLMEPRAMAQWHLVRALQYTSREEIAEEVGLAPSTLSNVHYGLCNGVRLGLTREFKRIADRLEAANVDVNPWTEFMEAEDTRVEVARLRATNPRVKKIRRDMAQRASGNKKVSN